MAIYEELIVLRDIARDTFNGCGFYEYVNLEGPRFLDDVLSRLIYKIGDERQKLGANRKKIKLYVKQCVKSLHISNR